MLSEEFIEKGSQFMAFSNLGGHCGHKIAREEFTSVVQSYFCELEREWAGNSDEEDCSVDGEVAYWKERILNGDQFSIDTIKRELPWLA